MFIDVGSFQPSEGGGPWAGYRQFCQTFLFPLMLQGHRGVAFRPLLRGQVDGITPAQARRLFSGATGCGPGCSATRSSTTWPSAASRPTPTQQVKAQLRTAGFDQELVKAVAGKLLRLVRKVTWEPSGSGWSGYGETCTLRRRRPGRQAGVRRRGACGPARGGSCTTSAATTAPTAAVAAEHADHVVAVDGDEVTIERLYRYVARDRRHPRSSRWSWTSPTRRPASGGATGSGPGSATAADADLVLALALVHHLALTNGVPLPTRSWPGWRPSAATWSWSSSTAPIRCPQRLLANKPDGTHDAYTLPAFEAALAPHFSVQAREELPGATRTLFHLTPIG